MVEQRTHKPCVAGSIPALATRLNNIPFTNVNPRYSGAQESRRDFSILLPKILVRTDSAYAYPVKIPSTEENIRTISFLYEGIYILLWQGGITI